MGATSASSHQSVQRGSRHGHGQGTQEVQQFRCGDRGRSRAGQQRRVHEDRPGHRTVERRADHREEQARVAVHHQHQRAVGRHVPYGVPDRLGDAGPERRLTGTDAQQGRHVDPVPRGQQVFGHGAPGGRAHGRAVHKNEGRLHGAILPLAEVRTRASRPTAERGTVPARPCGCAPARRCRPAVPLTGPP
ncbi:hypothetical protein ACQ4WX_06960 [Streptomyces lasalocidi]